MVGVMVPRFCEAPHPACIDPAALLGDCQLSHTRGSGPGGQHRNKVSTAVVMKHKTGVSITASECRSQQQNQKNALRRLRLRLALQFRCEALAEPTALWRSRSKGGKLTISDAHEDFPAVLAEALDHYWAAKDVKPAAVALGVSPSQLCKLFSKEPPALAWVNDLRRANELPVLRV